MAKVRVPIYGAANKVALLDEDATEGATFGVNVYDAGRVVSLDDIIQQAVNQSLVAMQDMLKRPRITQTIDGFLHVPSGIGVFGKLPPDFYSWNTSFGAGNSFLTLNKDTEQNDCSLVFTVAGAPRWEVGATTQAAGESNSFHFKRVLGQPGQGGVFIDVLAIDYDTGDTWILNKYDPQFLLNPWFVNGLTDWTFTGGWGIACDTVPTREGNCAGVATNPTTYLESLHKDVPAPGSSTFYFGAWINSQSATGGTMRVQLVFFDSAGNVISTHDGNAIAAGQGYTRSSSGIGLDGKPLMVTAPASATHVALRIVPSGATGTWYVDDAELRMSLGGGTYRIGIGAKPQEILHVSDRRAIERVTVKFENWNVLEGGPPYLPAEGSQSAAIWLGGVGTAWVLGNDLAMTGGDDFFVQWWPGAARIEQEQLLNPEFTSFRISALPYGVVVNGSYLEDTEVFRVESMGVGGFLPPRLTAAQRDAMGDKNPGLLIFNTSTNRPEFWNGGQWSALGIGSVQSFNYMAYGDSLTQGVGGTSWVDQFSALVDRAMFNGGVGGETSLQIKERLLTDGARGFAVTVIWAGTNNFLFPAQVKSDIAEMVASLGHSFFLVLGVLNQDTENERQGGAWYQTLVDLNDDLASAYGQWFVDIRRLLIDEGLTRAGIEPTAQDLIDIGNDVPPSSLRSDTLHLNTAGYGVVAQIVRERLEALGVAAGQGDVVTRTTDQIDDGLGNNNAITGLKEFQKGLRITTGGAFAAGAIYYDKNLGVVHAARPATGAGAWLDWVLTDPAGNPVLSLATGTKDLTAWNEFRAIKAFQVLEAGGNFGAGKVYANADLGLVVAGFGGGTYDLVLTNAGGGVALAVDAGTLNSRLFGDVVVGGTLQVSENVSLLKQLAVGQAAQFDSTVGVTGSLTVGGTATFNGTVAVSYPQANNHAANAQYVQDYVANNVVHPAWTSVSGSRGGNAALASLLSALAAYGWIFDNTTE